MKKGGTGTSIQSLSKILNQNNERRVQDGADKINDTTLISDKGSTKKSLMQVLKNANVQNMGFGESLGIAQSEFSNT